MKGVDSARSAASEAAALLSAGTPLKEVWRFVVLQLLDDYTRVSSREGVDSAAMLFADEPAPTGDTRVDAALAALAEHLARRDDWLPPGWAIDDARYTPDWWFVSELRGIHPIALRESPLSFRKRGVFITSKGLSRV